MGSAGDDGIADPEAHPDETIGSGSFDPGIETGYLRRAPRDHELSPDLGAAPFDPGPDYYDERRARKAARKKQRQEQRSERKRMGSAGPPPVAPPASSDSLPDDSAAASENATGPVAIATGEVQPDGAPHPSPPPPAETVSLRRGESMKERLERLRVEREREDIERRARIELERAEREAAERDRRERQRRERAEKLRRERAEQPRLERPAVRPAARATRPATPRIARVHPGVTGPVRKRVRTAENRRRAAMRRRGLAWPTAKAGLAVTLVLALGAGLGSALGLPVPGLDAGAGDRSLISSASLFGVDQGTPQGLSAGYVFPLEGPHDFGAGDAHFGASRYGHVHEGQDVFGKTGTPEVAVHDGVVVDRGTNSDPDSGGRGNYLAIYSPADNHSFVYMHMLKPARVQLGQQVHAGQVVGQLGCTGSCEGPHLHFEIRIGRASLGAETKPVDPLPYLRQWPQPTPG